MLLCVLVFSTLAAACKSPSDTSCGEGNYCRPYPTMYGTVYVCLSGGGHKCDNDGECASFKCINNACTNYEALCKSNIDCYDDDYYCNNTGACVKRPAKGESCTKQSGCLNPRGTLLFCIGGVCGTKGAPRGSPCVKGGGSLQCQPGLYCDLSSSRCEGITGGCVTHHDCRNHDAGATLCCNSKCTEPNHANLCP